MTSSRFFQIAMLLSLFAVAVTGDALAQAGTCGPNDSRRWCATLATSGVPQTPADDDHFGAALAFGDFNGDGRDDLAVGAPGKDDGEGRIWVFYSVGYRLSTSGVFERPLSSSGDEPDSAFGFALAALRAADLSHDDLAVGIPFLDTDYSGGGFPCGLLNVCNDEGRAYLFNSTGASFGPPFTYNTFHGSDDLHIGQVMAAVDIDGDGDDEIAFNEHERVRFFDAAQQSRGALAEGSSIPTAIAAGHFRGSDAIDVVLGAADDGPAGTVRLYADIDPIASLRPVNAVLTENNFGTSVAENGDNFGQAVAVGDFDGDGTDDVAIGAPFKDHGGNHAGVVYVAYGPLELGDQNDWDLLGMDSFAGSSPAADDRFGASLAAGDLDGDGDDDLVVGATGRSTGDRGDLFLFRGSSGGLVATVGATEAALGGTVVDDDFLGEVLAMGDVDGDGIAELGVGVPHRDVSGQKDAGQVYVTRIFDPAWVFKDDFESGNDLSWSDATN